MITQGAELRGRLKRRAKVSTLIAFCIEYYSITSTHYNESNLFSSLFTLKIVQFFLCDSILMKSVKQLILHIIMKEDEKISFSKNEIEGITNRFNQYAVSNKMNMSNFHKSMGLLGIGECQLLCNRIFILITPEREFSCFEFINFLHTITNGNKREKAKVSFDFLDRHRKGFISREDIEVIISEMSFAWNFLTGEKISNSESIELICLNLGIKENRSISFQEYMDVYENYIEWFDYFNNFNKQTDQIQNTFNINQYEEYLKLLHNELQKMIIDLRESGDPEEDTNPTSSFDISDITYIKGPIHFNSQEIKPRGDSDNPRESLTYYRASTLAKNIEDYGATKIERTTHKLQKFKEIGAQLFPNMTNTEGGNLTTGRSKKMGNVNMTEPEQKKKNLIYFGHQKWNVMLNMMLGIRKVLKTHFYRFEKQSEQKFQEEDFNCKYTHELIYKQHNKSVKEVCELFIVYNPKVFAYLRHLFSIDNTQFLKSIGLENLIGNLLMGNLSTLTEQMSEGKSGSVIYYTADYRMIVKEISHDECLKLKQILPSYVEYMEKNPDSFLPHIYGLYKLINKQNKRALYLIVIDNIFPTSLKIHERYDIKGSTYNRSAKIVDHEIDSNTALKDLDLMNNHRSFSISAHSQSTIFEQIKADSDFLASHNIIEYSLLIGIHRGKNINPDNTTRAYPSLHASETYFFGIIDVLTDYSTKKVLENHFMGIFLSDISCMAPDDYNVRFQNFLEKYIFAN